MSLDIVGILKIVVSPPQAPIIGRFGLYFFCGDSQMPHPLHISLYRPGNPKAKQRRMPGK
jgi:hypothetical protein